MLTLAVYHEPITPQSESYRLGRCGAPLSARAAASAAASDSELDLNSKIASTLSKPGRVAAMDGRGAGSLRIPAGCEEDPPTPRQRHLQRLPEGPPVEAWTPHDHGQSRGDRGVYKSRGAAACTRRLELARHDQVQGAREYGQRREGAPTTPRQHRPSGPSGAAPASLSRDHSGDLETARWCRASLPATRTSPSGIQNTGPPGSSGVRVSSRPRHGSSQERRRTWAAAMGSSASRYDVDRGGEREAPAAMPRRHTSSRSDAPRELVGRFVTAPRPARARTGPPGPWQHRGTRSSRGGRRSSIAHRVLLGGPRPSSLRWVIHHTARGRPRRSDPPGSSRGLHVAPRGSPPSPPEPQLPQETGERTARGASHLGLA